MLKYINLIGNQKSNLKSTYKSIKFRKTPGLTNIAQIDNYTIVYSPLAGRLYRLDKNDFIFFKNLHHECIKKPSLKKFIEGGLLIPNLRKLPLNFFFKKNTRQTRQISLFTTTECNLACRYCYKPEDRISYLDFDLTKKVIDKFIKDKRVRKLSIDFHGAGEPTLNIDLMEKVIRYAKAKKIKSDFNIQTNGVITEHIRRWLFKNMRSIAVSCDGPPKIQDKQRPFKNGQKSSPFVEKTIKFFVKNNYKDLFINAVVSSFSVRMMDKVIEYFYKLGVKNVGFSLLGETELSKRNKIYPPNFDDYINNSLKALKLADRYKMKLRLELLPMNEPRPYFCGAMTPQFCLTDDSYISSCYEATSKDSELRDFIYGRFNRGKNRFEYNLDKINYLKKRRVENIPECQNCYLKLVCAGDCPARIYKQTGSIFKPSKRRCNAARKLTRSYLIYKAKKELI